MVNNTININTTTNFLSRQIIKYKKDQNHIPKEILRQEPNCDGINPIVLMGHKTSPSWSFEL
jgi:hypothetical protein